MHSSKTLKMPSRQVEPPVRRRRRRTFLTALLCAADADVAKAQSKMPWIGRASPAVQRDLDIAKAKQADLVFERKVSPRHQRCLPNPLAG
jgi:1,2-phenylacetyl-CoA epoxidase catalytic subunit